MPIGQQFGPNLTGVQQFGQTTGVKAVPQTQEQFQSSAFPGLNEKQVKRLIDSVDKLGITDPTEKIKKQQEVYKQALPVAKQRQQQMQRTTAANTLYNNSLDGNKESQQLLRVSDFGDAVRAKVGDIKETDAEIINKVVNTLPNGQELFMNYLNNGDKAIFEVAGLNPKKDTNIVDYVKSGLSPEKAVGDRTPVMEAGAAIGQGLTNFGVGIVNDLGAVTNAPQFQTPDVGKAMGVNTDSELYKDTVLGTELLASAIPVEGAIGGINAIKEGMAATRISEARTALKEAKTGEDILKNKTLKRLRESIQPKQTPSEIAKQGGRIVKGAEGEARAGRTEATLFNKQQTLPTKNDISKLQSALDAGIDHTKSFETQGNQAAKAIQKNAELADKAVANNNTIFNKNMLKAEFNKIDKAPSDITPANKKKIQDIFMEYLSKEKNNMEGLHKAKQAFYQDNTIKRILNGAPNDMNEYVRSLSKATTDFIGKNVPEYAKAMKEETNLYNIVDNLATKMGDQSKAAKFYKDNESLIKGTAYGLGLAYGGVEGIKYISGN